MPIAASKTSTVGSVFAFVIRFVILERLRGTAMEGCRPAVTAEATPLTS
jgi:hypothetical protein